MLNSYVRKFGFWHHAGVALLACVFLMASTAYTAVINASKFNVYSLGNIGSASRPYGSDFQGVTGAAGDVRFGGFTLTGMNSINGNVLFAGGKAYLDGGDFRGSINVGGDVILQSFSISGDVSSGGSVTARGGTIGGGVSAASFVNFVGASASGQVLPQTLYTPAVDHAAISQYFRNTSDTIAAMSPTGTIQNNWGGLSYTATSGVNVISIDANLLKNAWGFNVSGPQDAVIYVNVAGTDVDLDWLNWSFSGGIGADDVLLNYNDALRLSLQMGGQTNILAPNADMTFSSGVWTGSVVAGNLYGAGQINLGNFSHYGDVPEPASLTIMLATGVVLALRRRISSNN